MYYHKKKRSKTVTILLSPFYMIYFVALIGGSFVLGIYRFLWELIKLPFSIGKPTTGHDYEYTAAEYLRRNGFWGVKVTKGSGDFGVDIIAHKGKHKYAVQCKYYSNPVGISAVQQAVAGKAHYGCTKAMVITNSTFTRAAETLAAENGVTLLDNITSAGINVNISKILKWVIILGYLLFAGIVTAAGINTIKEQSFGKAVYNIISMLIVIPLPLWIYLGVKGFKRYINKRKEVSFDEVVTPPEETAAERPKEIRRNVDPTLLYPYFQNDIALRRLANTEKISKFLIQYACHIDETQAAVILNQLEKDGLVKFTGNGYEWTEKAKIQ